MPESEVHLFSVENFWHPHEIGIFVTDRLVTIVCEGGGGIGEIPILRRLICR